jgi:hypothetical protein
MRCTVITDKKSQLLPKAPAIIDAADVANESFPSGPNSTSSSRTVSAANSRYASVASTAYPSTESLASSVDTYVASTPEAEDKASQFAAPQNAAGHAIVAAEIQVSIRLARAADVTTPQAGDATHGTMSAGSLHAGGDGGVTTNRTDIMVDSPKMGDQDLKINAGSTMALLYGGVTFNKDATPADPAVTHASTTPSDTQFGVWGAGGPVAATGFTAKTHINGIGVNAGLTVTGAAEGQLKVIGRDAEKKAVVEYRDTLSGGMQLLGGVSLGAVGIGFRLGVSGSRTFVFQTLRSTNEATALLAKSGKVRAFFAALRLHAPLISLPNLKDPLNQLPGREPGQAYMAVGDALQITYTGTLTGGIALTSAGLYVGAHASVTGTHSMKVTKVSDTVVEMLITPDQLTKAVAVGIDVPFLAEAHALVSKSRATSHGYKFDLSDPDGMAAYQNALEGKLPGPLMRVEGYKVLDAEGAMKAVAETELSKGVTYTLLEQAAMPKVRSNGFSVPLSKHIPFAKLPAIGLEKRVEKENTVVADGQAAVHEETLRHVAEHQALHLGVIATTSYGKMVREHGGSNSAHAFGVDLGVTIATSRNNHYARNKIRKAINKHFSPAVPVPELPVGIGNSKYGYEVGIHQNLSQQLLDQLTPAGVSSLQHAEVLKNQVAAGGLNQLVAVKDALGETVAPLGVSIQSAAPSALHNKALNLAYKYQRPIDPSTDTLRYIDKRVRKVNKYLKRIDSVRNETLTDTLRLRFDRDSREKELVSLKETEGALKDLVKLTHLRDNPEASNRYRFLKAGVSPDVRKLLEEWES